MRKVFEAESLEIQSFHTAIDFDVPRAFKDAASREEIIRDAERAFIKILKSKYNYMLYSQYPRTDEGLGKRQIDRILFTIVEPITLTTATTAIQGGLFFGKNPS